MANASLRALGPSSCTFPVLANRTLRARSAFDNYVSESSKITEMAVKTANDAIAPIRARVDGVVETFAENAN